MDYVKIPLVPEPLKIPLDSEILNLYALGDIVFSIINEIEYTDEPCILMYELGNILDYHERMERFLYLCENSDSIKDDISDLFSLYTQEEPAEELFYWIKEYSVFSEAALDLMPSYIESYQRHESESEMQDISYKRFSCHSSSSIKVSFIIWKVSVSIHSAIGPDRDYSDEYKGLVIKIPKEDEKDSAYLFRYFNGSEKIEIIVD